MSNEASMHATTIVTVRKAGKVVIAGDGQVSLGQTIMKGNARKVRRLGKGNVIAGFAGATADAFTLLERLEAKLERFPDQLERAAVELATAMGARFLDLYAAQARLPGRVRGGLAVQLLTRRAVPREGGVFLGVHQVQVNNFGIRKLR